MFSGKINEGKALIIKEFWIDLKEPLENLRVSNSNNLKPLKEIKKIFQITRNGKSLIGFDTGNEKATFIEAKRIEGLTNLHSSKLHILEGSFINPEYFREGELMYKANICRKSNVILKALNLRYFGNIEEMHKRFENNALS